MNGKREQVRATPSFLRQFPSVLGASWVRLGAPRAHLPRAALRAARGAPRRSQPRENQLKIPKNLVFVH